MNNKSKSTKKVTTSQATFKKGSLAWYKAKYGEKKGEIQYHLDLALKAQAKINSPILAKKKSPSKK